MLRIIRDPAGPGAKADPGAAFPGRGAYVCRQRNCGRILTKEALGRALRMPLSSADLATLRAHIEEALRR